MALATHLLVKAEDFDMMVGMSGLDFTAATKVLPSVGKTSVYILINKEQNHIHKLPSEHI